MNLTRRYLLILTLLKIFDLQAENLEMLEDSSTIFTETEQEIQQFQTLVIEDLVINSEDQNYLEANDSNDSFGKKESIFSKIKKMLNLTKYKENNKN